ncbi:MAG TPA: hypothetical protein VK995_02520 [Oceanipulchritudo sp.]|nr:hypothetical protein [Oceanipulchritudo sp.]
MSLPLYGSEFDKEIAQVEELPNGEPGSGTATFLYDVQDVIDYFIAHPKANSEPYAVMEKLESMPSGQRLYFNEFLAEERVELHMAMGFLKRQYQLRVFYNEMELARLQFRIEEAVYGPLAGSGYVNVCIGGVWMTYHMLWIS